MDGLENSEALVDRFGLHLLLCLERDGRIEAKIREPNGPHRENEGAPLTSRRKKRRLLELKTSLASQVSGRIR